MDRAFVLSPEAFDDFTASLLAPPPPTVRLRQLMREAVTIWNEEIERGLTDDEREFVEKLS